VEPAEKQSKQFHEAKAKEDGVVTLPSGLQYKILKKGTGKAHPTATDRVKVHYIGTFVDGSEFDSSVKRGQPSTFGLNQVIKGWTDGIQLMSIGDKFVFYIPWGMAYGAKGRPPTIPAYASLIFEVELFDINGKTDL